jgi:8-oxo-dGTP pyrophosphatase MutT (NUDIX family)
LKIRRTTNDLNNSILFSVVVLFQRDLQLAHSVKFSECVSGRLAELSPRRLTEGFVRQAAVLMPFFEQNGEVCLLLTRRTDEVETHKGQISFPGGMREEGETLERTAIRETFEEIGIAAGNMEILGRFHDYLAITDVRVTPFVAMLHQPFTVTPQAHEVAEILRVPCSLFLDTERLLVEKDLIIDGKIAGDYSWFYGTHRIWGLTALIIHDFFKTIQLLPILDPCQPTDRP